MRCRKAVIKYTTWMQIVKRERFTLTVPTNQIEFDSYHVSRVYSGKNVQIWYKKGDITKKESGMN